MIGACCTLCTINNITPPFFFTKIKFYYANKSFKKLHLRISKLHLTFIILVKAMLVSLLLCVQ